jgi:hypothetical protein
MSEDVARVGDVGYYEGKGDGRAEDGDLADVLVEVVDGGFLGFFAGRIGKGGVVVLRGRGMVEERKGFRLQGRWGGLSRLGCGEIRRGYIVVWAWKD